jgi:hypothetical protein
LTAAGSFIETAGRPKSFFDLALAMADPEGD